jgi:hypothetical protein
MKLRELNLIRPPNPPCEARDCKATADTHIMLLGWRCYDCLQKERNATKRAEVRN